MVFDQPYTSSSGVHVPNSIMPESNQMCHAVLTAYPADGYVGLTGYDNFLLETSSRGFEYNGLTANAVAGQDRTFELTYFAVNGLTSPRPGDTIRIYWGEGQDMTEMPLENDPYNGPDGWKLVVQHTYKTPGEYLIIACPMRATG
jgi:hypothetical protein